MTRTWWWSTRSSPRPSARGRCARGRSTARSRACGSRLRSPLCTCVVCRFSRTAGCRPNRAAGWSGRPESLSRSGAGPTKDGVLRQLALEARGRSVAGIERGGEGEPQQARADAHHLAAKVRLRHLATDAAGQDRVADKRVVRDHQANAARRVAGRVNDRHLELAEIELVFVDEVAVGRAQELLGVSRM